MGNQTKLTTTLIILVYLMVFYQFWTKSHVHYRLNCEKWLKTGDFSVY